MKTFATNKKALHDYGVTEKMEAGIVLTGHEVKSVKAGQISLKGAYVNIVNEEAYLLNAHIAPYKFAADKGIDPERTRKLLLHKSEIKKLIGKRAEKGLTLVPLEVYERVGRLKVLIGLGRGRKKFEKREALKKKEAQREIERNLKSKDQIQR